MMKKSLMISAMGISIFSSCNASADVSVTNMSFGDEYAVGGVLTKEGDGDLYSIDSFFGHAWTAIQKTTFLDNTGSWSGSLGTTTPYDYDDEIAAMTGSQRAVGIYFDWKTGNSIAILEIFDCVAGICTGQGVPMDNGPFVGSVAKFSGTGTVIPVPAAAWLMGSGVLGLLGVARHRTGLRN